ncbi:MAG: putative metal-binding motif-containing protein [Patescibacteria group bacterium]
MDSQRLKGGVQAVFALFCMILLTIIGQPAFAADADGDGYASIATGGTDCNDTPGVGASIYPNHGEELCDGVDEDCDGTADEGIPDNRSWYQDSDGDSHGNSGVTITSCTQLNGYVLNSDDCNDARGDVYPGQLELTGGLEDLNCDGSLPDADNDGDTWTNAQGDCNDNPLNNGTNVHPQAIETCNDVDDDCNGNTDDFLIPSWCLDADLDGKGDFNLCVDICARPSDHVGNGDDCNDAMILVKAGAAEICDGQDNNCDGAIDEGLMGCSP